MGSEMEINALPYREPTDNITYKDERTMYYCSFVRVGLQNDTPIFRFHRMDNMKYVQHLCETMDTVTDFSVWFALVLGVPGNIVALLTISTMPKSTATFYISLLSFSDLIALCSRACYSLFSRYKLHYPDYLCPFMHFILNYSVTYANWVLVFICFERYVTVRFPLKKSFYFTIRRARYSGIILAIVLLPVYCVFFFVAESFEGRCIYSPKWEDFYRKIISRVIESLYAFIPAILILLFTILVMVELRHHQKTRNLLFTDRPVPGKDHIHRQLSRTETTHTRNRRLEAQSLGKSITVMMMIAAFVFLLLTVPVCIVIIMVLDRKGIYQTNVSIVQLRLLSRTVYSINIMSHAINFYIYFLSAQKFRRRLCSLFLPKKNEQQQLPFLMSLRSSRA